MDQPLGSKYLLHAMIGQGAMGQVYRASVRETLQPVAVKVLRPDLVANPEAVARFFQERTILTSVSSAHVVHVQDLVVEGDTVAIVMELVEGSDLRSHLQAHGGRLPAAEAVRLASQLLAGAAAVHAAGIVHRDIKPENALLDTAGGGQMLKLTDFGIAKLAYGTPLTKLTSLIGTPEYMAPEIIETGRSAAESDIYSAGIVLYEMLSGRTPFTGGHPLAVLRRHVEQPPPPIPGLPRWLWALVEAMLAKDPADRPVSATAVRDELRQREPELAGLPTLPPADTPAVTAADSLSSTVDRLEREPTELSRPAAVQLGARARVLHRPAEAERVPAKAAVPVTGGRLSSWFGSLTRGRQPSWFGSPASGRQPSWPDDEPLDEGWDLRSGDEPSAGSRDRRPRRGMGMAVLAAAVVVALVIAGAVGFVLSRALGRSHTASAVSPQTVSYSFPPVQYPDGIVLSRKWTLSGRHGSVLTETDLASNAGKKRLRDTFADAIPATVTTQLNRIDFTPQPDQIMPPKRVAVWKLRVPARGERQVGYRAAVAPDGVSLSRLHDMAKAFLPLQSSAPGAKAATVRVTSLALAPNPLSLASGTSEQLTLSGKLASGKPAPAAVLQGAAWTSGNLDIAAVSPSGLVAGTAVGTTSVTAQIGSAETSATVTVTAAPSKTPKASAVKKTKKATAPDVKVSLTTVLTQTDAISCSAGAKPVTVTAAVTSTKAATITYDWLVNGVKTGSAATAAVSTDKALDLSYSPSITAASQAYKATVGLDVTSPAKASGSIALSYTCLGATVNNSCTVTAPDYACFNVAVNATSTDPVTLTWELLSGTASESTGTLTLSGKSTYTEPVMLGAASCSGSPCAAGTYNVDVTATGSGNQTAKATGTVTVVDASASPTG